MQRRKQRRCSAMASDLNRNSESFKFDPGRPHFFKIILQNAIHDGRLGIPGKFVRKYGNDLPDQAYLKVPTGAVWQIELIKCGGDVWLQKGWQEFAEYHSVAIGHVLVFEYEGNGHFRILIFDRSATEIEYPFNRTGSVKPENNGELRERESKMKETANDLSFEILCGLKSFKEPSRKSPLSCARPHKITKTDPTNRTCRPSKLHTSVPDSGTQSSKTELETSNKNACSNCSIMELDEEDLFSCKRDVVMPKGLISPGTAFTQRMKRLTGAEKAKVLHRVRGFKSKNPFFKVAMQPSYVDPSRNSKVVVPGIFSRKYFNKKHADVKLCNAEGRIWSAQYSCREMHNSAICNGWKQFSQDNCLRVGDVCVFELINRTKIILKVFIFRLGPIFSPIINDGGQEKEDEPIIHIDSDFARGDGSSKPIPRTRFSAPSFRAPER